MAEVLKQTGKKFSFRMNVKCIIETIRHIWKLDKQVLPSFMSDTVLTAIQPYITLYFMARIIDELLGGRSPDRLTMLVLLAVLMNLLVYLLKRASASWHGVRGYHLYWLLMAEMSRKLIRIDYKDIEGTEVHLKRQKILDALHVNFCGPWEVPGILMSLSEGLVTVGFAIALSIPVFLPKQGGRFPWSSLIMLTAITGSVLYSLHSEKRLYDVEGKSLHAFSKINQRSYFFGNYMENKGVKEIRLYHQKDILNREMDQCLHASNELNANLGKMRARAQGTQGLISQLLSGLAYLLVGLRALAGEFGPGSIVQYVGAITRLSSGIRALAATVQKINMQAPHCRNYLNFIDMESKKHTGTLPLEKRYDKEYIIEFRNVGFQYPGSDMWALKEMSLKLKIGERLAVVGRNGSGKTTFIKLLCRLYEPSEGQILLNGIDIRKYDYEDYLNLFSVVFQDFQLFSFKAGQNVSACMDVDEKRAMECLDEAGAAERIRTLPKGLETLLYAVGDEGVDISGGEAQKIALARALYKNAPIIVLDEPTAALDPVAEFDIYSRFNKIVGSRTAVYISHRLSSCRFCSNIMVFDEGRVVQRGNHQTLLSEEDSMYAKLWNAQAQYYVEEEAARKNA